MHALWTYCNAWEYEWSQVAYLLIWSRASANHLYLHLQRYVSFKAGPAKIISNCKIWLILGVSYDCAALPHRLYMRADKWINHHKHDQTNYHLNAVSVGQKLWEGNSNYFGLLEKSAIANWGHYSRNKWTKNQITKIIFRNHVNCVLGGLIISGWRFPCLSFIFIALVFLTWRTFDIDSLKREWALEMGARYGPAPAALCWQFEGAVCPCIVPCCHQVSAVT